jgi:hypothetical protein
MIVTAGQMAKTPSAATEMQRNLTCSLDLWDIVLDLLVRRRDDLSKFLVRIQMAAGDLDATVEVQSDF